GGDVPQVKGLEDIPTPDAHHETQFGRSRPVVMRFTESRRTSAGTWLCFAEVRPMKTKTRRYDDSASDELRERIQEALEEADEQQLREVAECLGLEHMDEDEDEDEDKDAGKTRDLAAGGGSAYSERRARRK